MIKLTIVLNFGYLEKTFTGIDGHANAVKFMRQFVQQGQQIVSHKMVKVG